MSNILQIAFTTEGSTDERFLGTIIEKTFESLLFDSATEIEIHSPVPVSATGQSFSDKIKLIAVTYNYFHVICVHCDSDFKSDNEVLSRKINPAFELVNKTDRACKNLVAVIPIQMTEAWMLADIDLFLAEINTDKSCTELDLPCKASQIESIADPKTRIQKALLKAQRKKSRRRSKLKISDLYTPLSQNLKQQELEQLPSFKTFKKAARESLVRLNYLQ